MTQEKSKTQNAVVIGGGFSGLATAALLAKQGWSVTLLEKNATLGGRARSLKTKGFTFDMGPSWYMMPEVFEDFFRQFGKKPQDYYTLKRLDPRYKVFFEKKGEVTITDNPQQNNAVFNTFESQSGTTLQNFLAKTKKVYEAVVSNLLYIDIWDIRAFLNLTTLRNVVTSFIAFPLWVSWQQSLDANFKSNHLKQVLAFTSLFLGGSPMMTPSMFSILTWADFGTGVWYPVGGMIKVIDALADLCNEQGVRILTNHEVTHISVTDGTVTGVQTKETFFPAEIVVGATDLPWLETQLLDKQYQTYPAEYWSKKTLGISAMMVYLGINKRLPKAIHHCLYFTEDWKQNFRQVFDEQSIPPDPSLYISVRSATDRSLVPKNAEEIVVLVPLGAKTSYSPTELKHLSNRVVAKLETLFKTTLQPHIVVKKVFTPHDFMVDYNSYNGTALGLAHTLTQSFWWRPHNKSRKVKGLFYAGQYTNPGVGVPTAIASAQIVSKMVGFASKSQQAIFKKGSTTYYNASLFFKDQIKQDVFVLYAYVRTIDDFVDQKNPDIVSLEKYWQETLKVWQGKKTKLPIVQQFISLAKRHSFDWSWIESFWQAMRADLTKKDYHHFSELEKYMYGSAEVVGLMMAKILGLPDKASKAAALQGKAMQLLNMIRDVAEDEKLGRKYLAYDENDRHDEEKWNRLIQGYLKKYYQIQKKAEAGYQYIPKKYLVPVKTAAEMYFKTAKIIERDPMIVWKIKVKPHKWTVVMKLIEHYLFL